MARHLLSAREVQTAAAGDHADGDGLSLRVQPGTNDKLLRASWVLRYTSPSGKRRELGLGSAERASIEAAGASLKKARKKADEARDLLDADLDPIDEKRARKAAVKDKAAAEKSAKKAEALTLRRYARAYHEQHVEPLRKDRFGLEWIRSIERHVPVAVLDTPLANVAAIDLLDALVPIMRKVPETGSKIAYRLARIFDAAVIEGLRPDSPIAPIKRELRTRAGRREYSSHASMPYKQVPTFITVLQTQRGNAARCLEFTILTASRTGEAIAAEWSEIDMEARTWTVPAARMKGREVHVAHLSVRAVEILKAQAGQHARYVFPSLSGELLCDMSMLTVLKRMGLWGKDATQRVTVHGFRATFSTWANELGIARPDVIEAALAHREVDAIRRAYNRSDFLRERRSLMVAWGEYLAGRSVTRTDGSLVTDAQVLEFPTPHQEPVAA